MNVRDVVVGMVGSGGDGVVAMGDILATTAAHDGLHCMQVKSFGPQIRGGESSCIVRIADRPVLSQGDHLNILVAFNWNDYKKFPGELTSRNGVMVVCDEKNTPDEPELEAGVKAGGVLKVPFDRLIAESGNPKAKNIIALGILAEAFNLPKDGLKKYIERKFKKKGQEVIDSNIKAVDIGINFAASSGFKSPLKFEYTPTGKPKFIATGNDAIAYGALAAGLKFFASYPITPASEVMEWLSRELPKFGGAMVQAEDEISAVCMVTGASFGGVKSMTSTSGPGVSLKIEALGLGSMAELPYVLVNVQRGGPATGIPTKSEQADLSQAVFGMHGDAPHAVVAPADVEDCFELTQRAFNIAENYQMPVILLSDQFIGHRKDTVEKFDLEKVAPQSRITPKDPLRGEYKRFAYTDTGVSPMSYPGIKGGEYICSGIEHNEMGYPTSSHFIHEEMSKKRQRKLDHLAANYKFIRRYGVEKADIGIIAWGSPKGAVREAVEKAVADGLKVAAIVPQLIYPLQADLLNAFYSSCKKIMVVEMSFSGQFRNYLAGASRLPHDIVHLKSGGARQFEVGEILNAIKENI